MSSLLGSVLELVLWVWDLVSGLLSWALGLVFTQTITLEGGHSVKVLHQLAEGGFGYVYLVQDRRTEEQYALKKMLCQTDEHLSGAKREIRYHRMFQHSNLLPLLDSSIQADPGRGPAAAVAYLLFPYLPGGSLRDAIDTHVLAAATPGGRVPGRGSSGVWSEVAILRLFQGVLQGVKQLHTSDPPLAHRDIKPENVLLRGDGVTPVLVDFGSMAPAVVRVSGRSQALVVQDEAATFSTMPYRAPELFDVPSETTIDARVDVWSLGCLLFALGYGYSPFESEFSDNGKLRVVECSYLRVIGKIPQDPLHRYSAGFEDLIRWMLVQDHKARPSVTDVVSRVEAVLLQAKAGPQQQGGEVAIDVAGGAGW